MVKSSDTNVSEKKILGHVPRTVAVSGPILVLGVGATSTVLEFPDIAVAISGDMAHANPAVATNPGVTQVQVDVSCVAFDQYSGNEETANSMIILIVVQRDVMTLLACPTVTGK